MECPECGGPLTSRGARIIRPRLFSKQKKFKPGHVYTQYRRVYTCAKCEKAFIQTICLMEVEVVGNT